MEFTPTLHNDASEPLYRQLYRQISKQIVSGEIAAGTRMPSIRQMAEASGVAKNTVEAAYQQLLAEGYLTSRERSGFFAAQVEVWGEPEQGGADIRQKAWSLKKKKGDHLSCRFNFHGSVVDTKHFPYAAWRSCMLEALDRYPDDFAFYGDDQGEWELREQLASYLRRARTLACTPEQIWIGTGLQQSLSFLCLLLADRHRVIAVEEPGYADARIVFSQHGYEVVPIPLDADGLSIQCLAQSGATVVYTTPSHQYPYGMVMPIAQRQQLLQWAERTNGIIIENDYDGEFRYNVQPTPSLQGLDREGRVVYIGNFSKAFSPALRMDYMVLPAELLERYLQSFQAYPAAVSRHLQRTMQLFMQKGHWEKHVRKMRTIYQRKHAILLQAIRDYMPSTVTVLGHSAGLHILLAVHTKQCEAELIAAAWEAGIRVYSSGRNWMTAPDMELPRIIVGFGGMEEDDIREGIRLLAKAWSDA